MPAYLQTSPEEAVGAARRDAEAGQEGVLEALDRSLRWHLLCYLQDRSGDLGELRRGLVEATHWAMDHSYEPWYQRWAYLLELLRDAERLPATAADLALLSRPEGRAAEVLAALVARDEAVRPKELAERLGMSQQQVANLATKLVGAGLIKRHPQPDSKASWLYVTPRGQRLAALLPKPGSRTEPELDVPLWNPSVVGMAISIV